MFLRGVRGLSYWLIVVSLGACSHPSDKAITAFAESTTAITSIAASASDLEAEIDDKTELIKAATRYGQRASPKEFPPLSGKYLDKQLKTDWAARVVLLKAIGAYAKALADANDPALAKSISDTAVGLSGALANVQGAAGLSSESARTELVGGIFADAAAFATEIYTAAKLREIMKQAHPKLERARDLIKKDLDVVLSGLKSQKDALQRRLVDKLELHENDQQLTSVDRYNLYSAATQELAAFKIKIDLLQQAKGGMDSMVAAHKDLLESSDDARTVVAFFALVQGVAEKAKKLEALQKSNAS